jgi:hypothetical protein
MKKILLALALALFALPAFAQATYPTVAGSRVNGVVPLVCDANGANCAPGSATVADPVGCVFNTTRPTATTGTTLPLQCTSRGGAFVTLTDTGNTVVGVASNGTDTVGTATVGLAVQALGYVFDGTTFARQRGDIVGTVTQPGLSATHWTYAAAAGGISNTTTAVTIKAAAGAGVRNCISSLQMFNGTLGAATEVAVRDGAAGTVLWRGQRGTVAISETMTFPVPICGTANTLLEVVTLTATVTGGVYVNVQGFTRP